jgi:leucyl aminopeptidase
MANGLVDQKAGATPLALVAAERLPHWLETQSDAVKRQVKATGFSGETAKVVLVPSDSGLELAIVGAGQGRDPFVFAHAPNVLPAGEYALVEQPDSLDAAVLAAAWSDGAYRFTRYKSADAIAQLQVPKGAERAGRVAASIAFLRDLVNTPACDMGPSDIASAAVALARNNGAEVTVTEGDALDKGYPMVAAVGRAATDKPRMIEISWVKPGGKAKAPKLVIVGKGVAFDTGGLNLKTGSNMGLMKKDMGGAAHALALAKLVMESGLDVRLSVLVPAVENAIGSGAFRPGDVLQSRKGLTVEIEDTDAEGRLILGDALARGSELEPDLMIDFATLTGAARVALGPDLAPLYTDDDTLAADINTAAQRVRDPVWRMPLWDNYAAGLKSPIADLKNLGDGPMGGSITAALFLKAFVDASKVKSWAHFDIWAWRPARYGRPAGAAANGLRAVWAMLEARYG